MEAIVVSWSVKSDPWPRVHTYLFASSPEGEVAFTKWMNERGLPVDGFSHDVYYRVRRNEWIRDADLVDTDLPDIRIICVVGKEKIEGLKTVTYAVCS